MKRLSTTLFILTFVLSLTQAQIVINEIMYNSPDGGQDSTEYIELFNNSSAAVDLSGWNFTSGINFTFAAGTSIEANAYLLVAGDAAAMMATYGVTAIQWESGGLSNGGESIELADADGNEMDVVEYDDGFPWPSQADGDGPSLELCSPDKDNNNGANWFDATTATGVVFEGTEVLATPGAANTATCPAADIMVEVSSNVFTPRDITIFVGETVEWNNLGGFHNVDGTLATYPDNPEGFGNGSASSTNWTFSYTFTIPGVYDYECTPHAALDMVGTVTVLPAPPNDIVISEIMYNIPGAGNNFDFIEITNIGNEAIDLEGYYFSSGIEFTFPAMMIQPGAYMLIVEDASAFNATFGTDAISWTDGGLNDGGEDITLLDANDELVDMVVYNDAAGWPEIADGEGPSLSLCDLEADNGEPESWGFSTTNTNIVSGGSGNFIYATPGAANDACATTPYIFLENGLEDVSEGDVTATFRLSMANVTDMDTASVTLNVVGGSAMDGTDFVLNNTIVTFGSDGNGGVSDGEFSISLLDDILVEGSETIILNLSDANGAVIASVGDLVITIVDNDGIDPGFYPLLEIQDVTTVDAEGVVDSINRTCELRGIVYGINLSPGGLLFTIVDKNDNDDGIAVFNGGTDFGYTVTEGDEVSVIGTIDQFRGLQQINADSVFVLSNNNALFAPEFTTDLGEDEESKLIRINNLTIVSVATGAAGDNYTVTDGTNEYTMRIDADNELFGTTLPANFDAIGLGGQFDNASPFDEGYQFLPRYTADILDLVNTNDPTLANDIQIMPNPVTDQLLIRSDLNIDQILIHNNLGQLITSINGTANQTVDVSTYTDGVYQMSFIIADRTWTTMFVKQ